jgi:hypothetical protein
MKGSGAKVVAAVIAMTVAERGRLKGRSRVVGAKVLEIMKNGGSTEEVREGRQPRLQQAEDWEEISE